MLQLLETGKALYVLAVFCGLGIFTRLITGHLYKRLLKESTNLAATRNKNLKELRQKAENTYRMNQGLRDSGAWLENQLTQLRFMGITLDGWNLLSMRWLWLCLLTGAAASFAAYWYHLDTLYIVMYGGGAILMAMFGMIFDLGTTNAKKEQLTAALRDYLENVMCPRLARNLPLDSDASGNEVRAVQTAQRPLRGRRELTAVLGNAAVRETGTASKKNSGRAARRAAAAAAAAVTPIAETEELEHQTDVEYVKQSLEQIAAGKEKARALDENWLKELKPEEMKLLSDILKEYLV